MAGEVWEPDALTAHVRIYEGPRVNEAKYRKIQAPTKYWMANRESTRYDKPKRPRPTHPKSRIGRFLMVNSLAATSVIAVVLSQSSPDRSICMTRIPASVVIAFAVGCVSALAVSGCSKAADRTLTIYQFQSTRTHDGQFRIDTSELPLGAIESTVDTGGPGDPVKKIKLNMEYEFEIVLRLVGSQAIDGRMKSDAIVH